MKYLIYAGDYNPYSGGVIVLHKLAKVLSEMNKETYIMCDVTNPKYDLKNISFNDSFGLALEDDCVVIYPEVIWGNVLNAKNVVRWVLYYPGVQGGSKEYDENENVFLFHREFGANSKYKDCPILNIFEPKTDYFYDMGLERSGECFLLKKGSVKHKEVMDGFYIDDLLLNQNADEIMLDIFNRYDRFISYDVSTYYSIIAALCGCTSIVMEDSDISEDDFYKNSLTKYGISYGISNIDRAISTKHLVKDNINSIYWQSFKTVIDFHQYCLDNFSGHKY